VAALHGELRRLPTKVQKVLDEETAIRDLVSSCINQRNVVQAIWDALLA
jgi:hypothetical protein